MLASPFSRRVFLILLLAAFLRGAWVAIVSIWLAPNDFVLGDSHSYWLLAGHIARGEPYAFGWEHARCFRMPGYPLILASLFALIGEPPLWLARAWSGLASTLNVALAMILAAQVLRHSPWRWRGVLLTGLGTAVYPELILSGGLVLSEAWFGTALLATAILWVAGQNASTYRGLGWSSVGLGLALGVGVLIRPSWALSVPIWLGTLLVSRQCCRQQPSGPSPRVNLAAVALGSTIFLLVLTPWWIRNARLYDTWIPTTLQTGASLYDGWNPQADGGSDMSGVDEVRLEFLRAQLEVTLDDDRARFWLAQLPLNGRDPRYWPLLHQIVTPLWQELQAADPTLPPFEFALDRELRQRAIDWAATHPGRVWELAWIKIARVWTPWPETAVGPMVARLAIALSLLSLIVLVGMALPHVRNHLEHGWILVLPALYFTLLHALFVGSIRYREPALYGLIVLAALGVASIASRLSLGKRGGFGTIRVD